MATSCSFRRIYSSFVWRLLVVLLLVLVPLANQPAQGAAAAPAPAPVPEIVEPRPFASAVPAVTLGGLGTAPVGSNVSFTVTFDNNDTQTGYGPYIDMVLDTTGPDGLYPGNPAANAYDGLGTTSISASYLTVPFVLNSTMWVIPFDASGHANHPFARDVAGNPIVVTAPAGFTQGDQLVVFRLPFGSFVQSQPPAVVDVTVNMSPLADIGTPLKVAARGGFQFGVTALDDWCCDLVVNTISGWDTGGVTPTLFTLTKTYSGPEGEAAAGPNFRTFYPMRYTVTASIAPGQTMTDVVLKDVIPANIQADNLISSSPAGPSCSAIPGTPGGTLTCNWGATVIGGSASFTFDFYIPLGVVPPLTGNAVTSCNNASATASWSSPDPRDSGQSISVDPAGCEHSLADRSIAIQKSVVVVADYGAAGNSPGDVLEYTLNFQVSDFFAFQNIIVNDVISDGQHFQPGFTPTISLTEHASTSSGNMSTANYTAFQNFTGAASVPPVLAIAPGPVDGTTRMEFRVSDELVSRTLSAKVLGGCVPAGGGSDIDCNPINAGATSGIIKFRTVIQENFTDNFPSGDRSVDQGDTLTDTGTIIGTVLNTLDLNPYATTGTDNTAASVSIPYGAITKSVYAVTDGNTGVTILNPASVKVKPGDKVTYKVDYTLPTSNFEGLVLTDYLPLPVFLATEVATFTNGVCNDLNGGSGGVPAAGKACLGTGDTYHNLVGAIAPVLSTDGTGNWVKWTYGNYDAYNNPTSKIELVFTVTVQNDPFADGLYLTNQANATETSTQSNSSNGNSIVQIQLTEPVLVGKKGIVASSNTNPSVVYAPTPPSPLAFNAPGTAGARWLGTINSTLLAATPINSNISGVDAGDLVTFAIVIQNTGTSINGAYDITIKDTLDAAGFEYPTAGDANSINLRVAFGNGTATATYSLPGGGAATPADLFGGGIKLDDPGAGGGLCQAHDPTTGNNVIIITYDLRVKSGIQPGTYTNTGTITNYSGSEGGPDFANPDLTDTATVTTAQPKLAKIATTEFNVAGNNDTQVVIGELVNYTLTVTVPEGVLNNAILTDTMAPGLAFVGVTSVTPSNLAVTTTKTIGTGTTPSNVTVGNSVPGTGNLLTFDFGNITNPDTDNAVPETIKIVFQAVTLNVNALSPLNNNQAGTILGNVASLTATGVPAITTPAVNVTVVEPDISIAKVAVPAANFDAGDAFTYNITLQNNVVANQLTAFDLTLSDPLPLCAVGGASAINFIPATAISVTDSAGLVTAASFELAGANTTGWTLQTPVGVSFDFPYNAARTITISVAGTVADCIQPNQTIQNRARMRWTSLDGDFTTTARSTYNTASVERTGADGLPGVGILNDYAKENIVANATSLALLGYKYFIASSEAGTLDTLNPPAITIGEIARYRIAVRVPEGVSPDLSLLDNIPAGLRFLNDGTAKVAFVSNTIGNITSSTILTTDISCTNLNQAGSSPTKASLPSNQITCPLKDADVSSARTTNTDTSPVYGLGTDVYFKFGNIVNNERDGDDEYIVVEFNALMANENTGGNINQYYNNLTGTSNNTDRTNTLTSALLNTASTGTPVTTFVNLNVTVRVAEPSITNLTKSAVPNTGDAGDTVEYTVTFSNANGAYASPAYDVIFTDTVPAKTTLQAINPATDFTYLPAACGTFTNNNTVLNAIDLRWSVIPAGCQITIKYRTDLLSSVNPGEILQNSAQVVYTSLPGAGSTGNVTGSNTPGASGTSTGERTGIAQGTDGTVLNNYMDTANAPVTIIALQPNKYLVSTTDPLTLTNNLTIGEVARFRMAVLVAEGTSPAFSITDNLPAGFQFLDDGSARFIFVSNESGIASSTLTTCTPIIIPTNTNGNAADLVGLPTANVTCLLTGAISGGPFGNGTDPVFNLGDITNGDTDPDAEYVVVEFNVRVMNVIGNQDPGSVNNNFTVFLGGVSKGTSGNVPVNIVEPNITLNKSVAPFTVEIPDAGGKVYYTVTLNNSGNAPAYETNFADTLPGVISLDAVSVSVALAAGASGDTNNNPSGTGNKVDITIATIPVGGSATITYTAIIQQAVTPGQLIQNTGTATWTSLSGAVNQPDERDGSNGPGPVLNNYTTTATASFNASSFTIAKSYTTDQAGTADPSVAIGEIVTYDLLVTLPEGTTPALSVIDNLPLGLQYIPASASVVSSGFGGSFTLGDPTITCTLPCGSGDDLTFNFASPITVTGNNTPADNSFILRYQARVLNVLGNQGEAPDTNLINTVTAVATVPAPINSITRTDTKTVTIVEPKLNVTKTVSNATPAYGQTLTYTLAVTHLPTSTSTAYDIVMTDTIPAGLTFVDNPPVSPSLPANWTYSYLAPTLTLSCLSSNGCSYPLGGPLSLTYNVTVNGPPAPPNIGDILTNAVAMTWTSLDGSNPNERTGVDGLPGPGILNDYKATTSRGVTLTYPDLAITKSDGLISYVPGAPVVYTIVASNVGNGDVSGAKVTDSFPAIITSATWICSGVGGATCTASGSVAISDTINVPAGQHVTYTVTAQTNPAATTNLVNAATATLPAGFTDTTPGDNTATDTDTPTPQVDLSITKTDGSLTYIPGNPITYTILVANLGPSNVIGATVADTFPASLIGPTWTCAGVDGATCTASGSVAISDTVSIPAGASVTYTVNATVSPATTGNLVNIATVAAPTGVTDLTPGNNTATDTDTPNSQADLSITKTDGSPTYVPGNPITYTLVVSNAGPSNVIGATVADTFPASLIGPTWTCAGVDGATCTASGSVAISDTVSIPAGASVTYTVNATVSPATTGNLVNTATVAAPTGVTDLTPGNNTATDTDAPDLQADLSITKTDGSPTYVPGSPITYTLVVSNLGPSNVIGATVADTFPASLISPTWTCAGVGGATCTASGSVAISDTVSIPAGQHVTYTVTAQTNPAATGNLVNTATVAAPTGVTDLTPGNNIATDTDAPDLQADLSITKTDGSPTYVPGSPITYTLVVSNLGSSNVIGATVADTFPASLLSPTWTCAGVGGATCTASGSSDISDTVSIPAGQHVTYTVTAQTNPAATGNLVNTATVAAPTGVTDLTPGNNTATDTDTPDSQADLSITKTDGSPTYVSGNPIAYTLVVSNAGPSNVIGATVADTFPASLLSPTWNCAGVGGAICTASGSGDISDTVSIPAGASVTYTVNTTVSPAATGSLVNTATVAAPTGVTDTTPGNNSATDTDTPNLQTDLVVTKTDSSATYTAGSAISYSIVVSNAGPSDAMGASVSDPVPAAITGVTVNCVASGTASCGTDGSSGNSISFTGVSINAGALNYLTITVSGTISAGTTGNLANMATVTTGTGQTDPTPGNNTFTDTDLPAALTVTKDDGATIVAPGAVTEYEIKIDNTGIVDLTSVDVKDTLPADVTFLSADLAPTSAPAPGTPGGTLKWTGISLPVLSPSLTIKVRVQVSATPKGTSIDNLVEVLDTITNANASAHDLDNVAVSNVKTITSTSELDSGTGAIVNPEPVFIGEILTYKIHLDVPEGTMTNLTALDILDPGLAFVQCDQVTTTGSLTTSLTIPPGGTDFSVTCNNPTNPPVAPAVQNPAITAEPKSDTDPNSVNQGRRIEFTFGDVTAGPGGGTLEVVYRVIVLDVPSNVNDPLGTNLLNNHIEWKWNPASPNPSTLAGEATPVRVTEPALSIAKTAQPTTAVYGTPIDFALDIAHTSASTAPAYDVVVTDVLPSGLSYVPGSIVITGLAVTSYTYDISTRTLRFVWDVFPLAATAKITFQAVFVGPSPVLNEASAEWTSLAIDPALIVPPAIYPISPFNIYSTERWYDPASLSPNNYRAVSSITISLPGENDGSGGKKGKKGKLPGTGFAPDVVTILPAQPEWKAYTSMGDIWLEIPNLGLTMPVTGVPIVNGEWDLTWLSNQAGYLEGTTYPGQVGTSGITGHVTLADGTPGPFRNLEKLVWGDQIILHIDGQRYIYEMRELRKVIPSDFSIFKYDRYTWITLITCKDYAPLAQTYSYRTAVRAVLVRIEPDSSVTVETAPQRNR